MSRTVGLHQLGPETDHGTLPREAAPDLAATELRSFRARRGGDVLPCVSIKVLKHWAQLARSQCTTCVNSLPGRTTASVTVEVKTLTTSIR
jgi:hypothetical protein